MLGLPDGVSACLFDLDGVLTDTAKVHGKGWKQMFDEYLRQRVAARDQLKGKPELLDGPSGMDGPSGPPIGVADDKT